VTRPIVLLSLLATLVLAAPASAAVLVEGLPKRLVCGDPITPGIWAQPGTTGSRVVRMKAIETRTGHVWWRKKARAVTSHWRRWVLPSGMNGRCHRTTFVYQGHGMKAVFHIRFRSEGD
jgi:hypothetical protein